MKKNSDKYKNLTDIEIIEKYHNSGNKDFVGILYQRYFVLVYGLCLKYLTDKSKSKDAVTEIFESLFTKLKTENIYNFNSWLYTVSKNHCLMMLRKNKRRKSREENYHKDILMFYEDSDLNEIKEKEIKIDKIKGLMGKLEKKQKDCLELFYIENKSYEEISEITSYTKKQVKSSIQNGKRNLKNMISEYNGK